MKLRTIYEAYDKNLGNSIARKYDQDPTVIKAWVQAIDPNYTYAPWILKQLKQNTPSDELQAQLKQLITKFKDAAEHSPDTLISTDINQYTLESLQSALDTYNIRGEFNPESLDGVKIVRDFYVTQGFGATEGVKTRIRAYLITDPTSLTKLSEGRGWCVRGQGQANEQMTKTPVVMIFRNNEATALGDVIGSELMNSQNQKDKRTEVQQLIKELKGDDSILESLSQNPRWAYRYALWVIKGRWPDGEQAISKDPYMAYQYARDVIHGRWPEGEKTIIKNLSYAMQYADDVIKGRWSELEEIIRENPALAYEYAEKVIQGRWPEAEHAISQNERWAREYARDVIGGPWPEAGIEDEDED